jgi:hypothetical protein
MYAGRKLLLWAGMVLSGAACVRGDTLVPTFGPNDSYNLVDVPGTAVPETTAIPFIAPASANVLFAGATIALSEFGATSAENAVDVRLATDLSGAPGSVLENFHLVDALPLSGQDNSPVMASAVLGPILLAGKKYWLIAALPDAGIELDRRH